MFLFPHAATSRRPVSRSVRRVFDANFSRGEFSLSHSQMTSAKLSACRCHSQAYPSPLSDFGYPPPNKCSRHLCTAPDDDNDDVDVGRGRGSRSHARSGRRPVCSSSSRSPKPGYVIAFFLPTASPPPALTCAPAREGGTRGGRACPNPNADHAQKGLVVAVVRVGGGWMDCFG